MFPAILRRNPVSLTAAQFNPFATLADEIVSEGLSSTIRLQYSAFSGRPDHITVHEIGLKRYFEEKTTTTIAIQDHVLTTPRICVICVDPNSGALYGIGNQVAPDQAAITAVQLYPATLVKVFRGVKSDPLDYVVFDKQAELDITITWTKAVNAADATVGNTIVTDDMESIFHSIVLQPLPADIDTDCIYLLHGVPFDNPMMAARRRDRTNLRERPRSRGVLDCQPADAYVSQVLYSWGEDRFSNSKLKHRR